MADTELNISPDEKIAGVPLARLLRNLDETSYNEGAVDLACRLTDCKAVIEELLQHRALASRPAEVDDKVEIFQAQVENGHWCDIEESSLSDWESMHIRTRCVLVSPSNTTNKDK